jgi:general secretion pathway protein D
MAAIVVGLFAALVFAVPGFADSLPVLSVTPASSSIDAGSDVPLDIDISGVTDLYGFQFDLNFDPGTLSAASITEGSFLSAGGSTFFLAGTIDNNTGTIAFTANSLLGPGPGAAGSGTLAIVTLTGIAEGSGSVDLSDVILLDSNLNLLDASLLGASVTVTPKTVTTPEPGSLLLFAVALGILALWKTNNDRRMTS